MTSTAISTSGSIPVGSVHLHLISKPGADDSPEAAGEHRLRSINGRLPGLNRYDPNQKILTLERYINDKTYVVTSGWVDPVKFFPNKSLRIFTRHLKTGPRSLSTPARGSSATSSRSMWAAAQNAFSGSMGTAMLTSRCGTSDRCALQLHFHPIWRIPQEKMPAARGMVRVNYSVTRCL